MHLGIWEILLIALVVLLLFGGRKIPELMKGLGKGMKNFRDGLNGKDDDEKPSEKTADQATTADVNTDSATTDK